VSNEDTRGRAAKVLGTGSNVGVVSKVNKAGGKKKPTLVTLASETVEEAKLEAMAATSGASQ
jgi:hypothetical protein